MTRRCRRLKAVERSIIVPPERTGHSSTSGWDRGKSTSRSASGALAES